MPTATPGSGTIQYERSGPADGRPSVFIHGYAMGGSLCSALTERLSAAGFSCVAPTWPLAAHSKAMNDGANLTIEGWQRSWLSCSTRSSSRTSCRSATTPAARSPTSSPPHTRATRALALTTCDDFERFPPPILKPYRRREVPAGMQPPRVSRCEPESDASEGPVRSRTPTSTPGQNNQTIREEARHRRIELETISDFRPTTSVSRRRLCSATRKCPNPRFALAFTNSPKRSTPQQPASRVREHGRVTP